jgi:hypothetical protein
MTPAALSPATPLPLGVAAAPASHGLLDGFFDGEEGGFSFHDLFSVINPLQHIPVVSTLYRAITGDTIKPLARVAGDTLYGGWMGCVSSVANIVFEKETGKDFGDTVLAFVEGDHGSQSVTDVAAATSAMPSGQAVAPPQIVAREPVLTALQPGQIMAPPLRIAALPTRIATKAPAPLQNASKDDDRTSAALASSMVGANVDPEIARRALYAYRRTLGGSVAPLDLSPAI